MSKGAFYIRASIENVFLGNSVFGVVAVVVAVHFIFSNDSRDDERTTAAGVGICTCLGEE